MCEIGACFISPHSYFQVFDRVRDVTNKETVDKIGAVYLFDVQDDGK